MIVVQRKKALHNSLDAPPPMRNKNADFPEASYHEDTLQADEAEMPAWWERRACVGSGSVNDAMPHVLQKGKEQREQFALLNA